MEYRILKDGKGVGTFHINKADYNTYNAAIVLTSGNKLPHDIFVNVDTVAEVKAAFAAHHGGSGYVLEDLGAGV